MTAAGSGWIAAAAPTLWSAATAAAGIPAAGTLAEEEQSGARQRMEGVSFVLPIRKEECNCRARSATLRVLRAQPGVGIGVESGWIAVDAPTLGWEGSGSQGRREDSDLADTGVEGLSIT